MKRLQNKTNVVAPGGDYPYGRIKNNTGANDGTPVDVDVYGDFHQFFERLIDQSDVTANGNPDNSTSGFQLFEAFLKLANRFNCTSTSTVTLALGSKSFAVTANAAATLAYKLGMPLYIQSNNSPGKWMFGTFLAFSANNVVITVLGFNGSGSDTSWTISIGGFIAANEAYPGITEIATQTEVNAGSDNSRFVTPLKLKTTPEVMGVDGAAKLRTKVIPIGDWDMDTDLTVSVAHGLTAEQIRTIYVQIRPDTSSGKSYKSLLFVETASSIDYTQTAGSIAHSNTDVILSRREGGEFDDTAYNATSFNRGWVTITYEA